MFYGKVNRGHLVLISARNKHYGYIMGRSNKYTQSAFIVNGNGEKVMLDLITCINFVNTCTKEIVAH